MLRLDDLGQPLGLQRLANSPEQRIGQYGDRRPPIQRPEEPLKQRPEDITGRDENPRE